MDHKGDQIPRGSLTALQNMQRACNIWGADRLISVSVTSDGGMCVNLRPAGIASDTRGRNYSAHELDAYGHVTCHDDCKVLAGDRPAAQMAEILRQKAEHEAAHRANVHEHRCDGL